MSRLALAGLVVLLALGAGCRRASKAEGATGRELSVQVPAALQVARGLDTLSVQLDPDLLARRTVRVEPGWTVGLSYRARVFEQGQTRVESERHGDLPGRGFKLGTLQWRTGRDGLPRPGNKYLVEMKLVLFETDVPPGPHWNPHSGHFKPLFSRTLRQAEE